MSPAASGRPRLGLVGVVAASFLGAAQLGASCSDGVTPDCSDPAVCAPSEGDAGPTGDGSVVVREAGPDDDAGNIDAEAGLDTDAADADGG